MVIQRLQWQSDLEANHQGPEGEIEDNHVNGRDLKRIYTLSTTRNLKSRIDD
jgi:hypothetical protein